LRSALFMLLFLGGLATAQAQVCASCEAGRFDEDSRLCLPVSVEGASTVAKPQPGKGPGNPFGATYQAMLNRLSVTLLLYDRDKPTFEAQDEEMRSAVREVLNAHGGAKVEMDGATVLPVGGDPTAGEAAWISWSESLTDHVSLLWLLPRGPRWLKISAMYVRPAENTGDAAQFALGFVRSVANAICWVR
jgi:hypothetical protein